MIPLGKAEILREGNDVTVVGWGGQLRVLEKACDMAERERGVSCEIIDLRTILPWDVDCVVESVSKTGKLVVSHEAPITCGVGAEIVATVQEQCFLSLQAPIRRVCGYDTPFPLVYEKFYVPDELKNLAAIIDVVEYAQTHVANLAHALKTPIAVLRMTRKVTKAGLQMLSAVRPGLCLIRSNIIYAGPERRRAVR